MSAKKKRPAPAPISAATVPSVAHVEPPSTATSEEPFYKRHPKIANVIYAALWAYVAALWLLALDQTFHWGIFGPKVPLVP
jgi:hypothetical protein